MNFVDDLLFLADGVRFEALVPLHPVGPHFIHLIFLELSGDAEPGHCVDIGVEIATVFQVGELGIEDLYYLFLLGLYLGQFAVANT